LSPSQNLAEAPVHLIPGRDPVSIRFGDQLIAVLPRLRRFARGLTVPLAHWPGYAAPWRNYYELTVDNLAQVGITAELKPEDQSRYATMTFLGKFDKMAMGPFGAGVTEIDELLYETFFSASPSYLPMWPRYITYPSYVKGFRNQDGASLGSRLLSTWFDR